LNLGSIGVIVAPHRFDLSTWSAERTAAEPPRFSAVGSIAVLDSTLGFKRNLPLVRRLREFLSETA
jgi:hypothetical protein